MNGFGGCRAESTYLYISLFEIGEIFQQRLYSRRAEKDEHIVVERFVRSEIVAYRAVHDCFGIVDFVLVEQRIFTVIDVGDG